MEQQLTHCPVRRQALLEPDTLAIKEQQQSLSYQELDRRISLLEKQLFAQGLKAGDRLICIAVNSLKLILLQLSCLRSGIIFCPINPRFSQQEIETRLNILNSQFIWFEEKPAGLDLSARAFDFNLQSSVKSAHSPLKLDPRQVINIIFTSGSSGHPKAVMHNFSNHFYSALGSQALIPLSNGDNNLLSLPIFHISGYATVLRTFLAGATLILSEQPVTVNLLKAHKITHLSLVATQLYRLLKEDRFQQSNLHIKHLLLGGSAFSKQLLTQTAQRDFTYHLSYGLTEMSSQVATSCNNQCLSILKHREVKIVNHEIYLRGKTRFLGYFNGQIENSLIPESEWYASKDLGQKRDQQLQIIGRKDRQFISGGENIQPEEIEALLTNFPAVKQAYVVAVNDPTFGKRPVAFIDWLDGQAESEALDNYIHNKLITFKCPIAYFNLPQQRGLKVSLASLEIQAETNLHTLATKEF